MAHLAKLGALADELVTLITSTTAVVSQRRKDLSSASKLTFKPDSTRFNAHRESALRLFRHNTYPRTNQFDVSAQLDGLEEKFRVFNEDPLADALRERVNQLAKLQVKWAPEILQLLLTLSDQPIKNSKLEYLDALVEPHVDPGPTLRWKELVAEDPLLREKNVWRNVDFAAESSDEDGFDDTGSLLSEVTDSTTQSSLDDDPRKHPADYVQHTDDKEGLESLQKAQFWREAPSVDGVRLETVKQPITELQVIREVLFMLSGFPTSIYDIHSEKCLVRPSKSYTIKHVSTESFQRVSKWFAELGSSIHVLRSWIKRPQTVPLLQVFQGAISDRLRHFDARLSDLHEQYVLPKADIVVSLLSIQFQVSNLSVPLVRLSEMIRRLDADRYLRAFRYLELLYEETCAAQMAGDDEMFGFIAKLFFECFRVYLQPIRNWMEQGELEVGDSVFFVSEVTHDMHPAAIWQARYRIRKTQEGALHAPKFLHTAAQKIFTTGKSVVVLKQLHKYSSVEASRSSEPVLDFENVCKPDQMSLAPFPALFDAAFDAWIQSKYRTTSETLREILFESCGLHRSLDALTYIYFQADGSATSSFCNSIFDKLDTLDTSWSDRFTLTELAHSTIGSHTSVICDRLRASVISDCSKASIKSSRKSVTTLAAISIRYQLSWPIQIILNSSTMSSYHRIFTFLLQVRRSSHILTRHRLLSLTAQEPSRYYKLRSCLLWFTSTLHSYLTTLLLKLSTIELRQALRYAEDVDSMITVHNQFIESTIDQTLLGSKLELIHETVVKILDSAIDLQDRQATEEARRREASNRQKEMMDVSMAGLGLRTPSKANRSETERSQGTKDDDFSDLEKPLDVDLSILSDPHDKPKDVHDNDNEAHYIATLSKMKADFVRDVKFIAGALKGVARAGGGGHGAAINAGSDEASAAKWDVLGDMLEDGLNYGGGRAWAF